MSAIGRRCRAGFRSFVVSVGMQSVWGRVVLGLEGEDAVSPPGQPSHCRFPFLSATFISFPFAV
jgi:hypothetical protein